jgi:hypothetical protein
MENKYSDLEKLLCGGYDGSLQKFMEEVNINKIDFFFLCSLLGGGSYNLSNNVERLLMSMNPKFYDYDALVYFRAQDSRSHEAIDKLIERIPESKRISYGLQSFKK